MGSIERRELVKTTIDYLNRLKEMLKEELKPEEEKKYFLKYQEAWDSISEKTNYCQGMVKEMMVLKELVDKFPYYEKLEARDTPMKPIDNRCPNCKTYNIRSEELNSQLCSCLHCGQVIDWEGISEDEY